MAESQTPLGVEKDALERRELYVNMGGLNVRFI